MFEQITPDEAIRDARMWELEGQIFAEPRMPKRRVICAVCEEEIPSGFFCRNCYENRPRRWPK